MSCHRLRGRKQKEGHASRSAATGSQAQPVPGEVREPTELAKVIAQALRVNRHTFRLQTAKQSIEVVYLEVDHRLLCGGSI